MNRGVVCAFVSTAFCLASTAQTITVDLAQEDFMDFGGARAVGDLPGPDGHVTLREAVEAANNTPGPQTIAFAIPVSEWSIFFTDRAIIRLENMIYLSDDDTTLDFSTQADFTGDTNPNGGEVGVMYAGVPASVPSLWLAADRCVVRGLDIGFGNNFSNTIWITGNQNRVVGCTTNGLMIRGDYGGGAFNIIGGTEPGDGNRFAEWLDILSNADDNVVAGNLMNWGMRISGDTFWGTCDNNRVGGPTAAERNTLSGKGYYAEEGLPSGTQLEVFHAHNTIIEGNFIGTTVNGMAKYPGYSGAGGVGVGIGAVGTVIRDNVVAGILMVGSNHYQGQRFGTAISVAASAQNTTIIGNRIGVGADGLTAIPNRAGIDVQSNPNGTPTGVLIGGTETSAANLVAFCETTGVRVANTATRVRISGNSIRDNGGLGIDLVGVSGGGVTPNEPLDGDTGGNLLQNFPVLTSATAMASSTRVIGTLNSAAGQVFTIEFFGNVACDSSGFGEGATYVGATVVTTNAFGDASFDVILPATIEPDMAATATATDSDGNTSEFSACVAAATGWLPGDMNCDGTVNPFDIQAFVTALASISEYELAYPDCSVSNADVNANGTINAFDIGPFIALLTQ